MGNFLCGVEMVKPHVNAHLHCIVGSLKLASKMSTLPINGKFSVNSHACVVCVYNVTSALYCALNNHFCAIRVSFVRNLSVNVSLNVRFTRNRVCMKTDIHMYVARIGEGFLFRLSEFFFYPLLGRARFRGRRRLKPIYICKICEFLGNNYCIPKRWPMGPFQQSLPPPGSNL